MESNFITSGDLAMWDTARTSRAGNFYGDGFGYGCHRGHGAATTGVALGASALGVAFVGAIAIGWGINQASKARSAGNAKAIDILAQTALADRQCRENWQNMHAPTITQYTDVRTGAGAFSGAGANATADALALSALINGNGNGRSGQVCPQPVALYQPAMPCRCNNNNNCGD